MVRLGYLQRRRKVDHCLRTRPDARTNLAGGLAFEVADPAVRLMTMVGASFFDEPTFYGERDSQDNSGWPSIIDAQLSSAGLLQFRVNALSERTRETILTATAVAATKHPRDLLAVAHWARREMNIRTTPCVLLAIAASQVRTKPFVRDYCCKIICRADELRQVFAAYLHLFSRPLPNSLKRGLADAFGNAGEFELLRYDTRDRPTFADVLLMVDRGRGRAVSQPLFEYLVNRKVIDPQATPLIAARKVLARLHHFDEEAKLLASRGRAPWEVLLSQFGNKREIWEFILNERLISYMALLRNLRNILRRGVNFALVDQAARQIEEGVADSKQLPFRFLSAHRVLMNERVADPYGLWWISQPRVHDLYDVDAKSRRRMLEALDHAMLKACDLLPRIPGTSVIAADNSGSMSQPLSRNSMVTAADAANLLCVMAARVCECALVWAFGTDVAEVRLHRHDGVIANMERVTRADTRGRSTNAYRVFQRLRKRGLRADRVILISDMQCWNSCDYFDRELAPEFFKYRNAVNQDVWLHSVDLVGHSQSVVPTDVQRVNLVSGFSEKILTHVLMAEGLTDELVALPSIEYIREKF